MPSILIMEILSDCQLLNVGQTSTLFLKDFAQGNMLGKIWRQRKLQGL